MDPTSTSEELRYKVRQGVELLQALRDEVRLKIHLAGMDAKGEWRKLEPKIGDAENLVDKASHEVNSFVEELVKRIEKLNASLN